MPQKVKQEHWCFEIGGVGQGTGVGNANPMIGEPPNYRRQLWEGEAEMALRLSIPLSFTHSDATQTMALYR